MIIDHLIVGSGLAGLSFAALAANAGRSVLMVEAHEHPGGYGHTFSYGNAPREFTFNAQFHYVWNCGPGRTVNSFLRKLGLEDQIPFERLDPEGFDRMRMPGHALDIPSDPEALITRLQRSFPDHAAGCRAFVEEVFATAAELSALPTRPVAGLLRPWRFLKVLRWRDATLGQVFAHFGLPPAARALLALQWPDFLLPPRDLSFFAWVQLFVGYCDGAWYPTHHFASVIDGLVGHVRARGGEVRVLRRMTRFILEGDRVVGAELEVVDAEGRATGEREQVRARHVVANLDPRRAAEMIGLERFSPAVRRRLDYTYSASNFMAYCAVEGLDLREHGFGRNNLFHAEDPDLDGAFDDMVQRGDYRRVSFAMTTPSLITADQTGCPAGCQLVELLTVADYDRWQVLKNSGSKVYNEKKREVFDRMLDVIERDYVPGFRDHLVFKLLGSPTTNQRYVLSPAGNSYGADLIPSQMGPRRLTHESSIPGLSFCNASAGYPGFTGTIWTGATLWEAVSGDPVLTGPHVLEIA